MLLSSRPFFAQRVAIWLTWMRVTFRTRPLDSKGSPSDSRRTSSANSSSVTRVGMEAFFRASGAAWSEHLRARQKACMSVRRLASHTGRRGASLAEAPSIQLVHGAVVRAVQALLHVVLKEPVLESRPRETAVEHADADQRARSNGVACSLQRHLKGGESGCVCSPPCPGGRKACLGARIRKACASL